MEPVFRGLEIAAKAAVAATGTRITYQGLDHIPDAGGAVIAINHTGYVDFLPAGLAATHRKRRVRFMLKAEVQRVPMGNFLVKRAGLIPVDRSSGGDAYPVAVARLRAGELVGVYPEATISRSFELKEFKTGVARMALDAQVPIIPVIVWGVHRMWTKDHPKRLGRKKDSGHRPGGCADLGERSGGPGDGDAAADDDRSAPCGAGGIPAPGG